MKVFGAWLAQQFLAVAGPLACIVVVDAVLSRMSVPVGALERVLFWTIGAPLGYLGYLVGRAFPGAARSGRWVWILPVAFFVSVLAWSLAEFPLRRALSEVFSPKPPGGLVLAFVVVPAWWCCCYSAGIHLAARRKRPGQSKARIG
jgi:hypothetical protein